MKADYLGRVPIQHALDRQTKILAQGGGAILGFEAEPVVTLGVRARAEDAQVPPGYELIRVDRGGQATLHNPGQLVIFPVVQTRDYGGARAWVCHLTKTTQRLARRFRQTLHYDESAPGLYTEANAKVASIGVRLRQGISTHGIAINVRNDLAAFQNIRACGKSNPAVAHLKTDLALPELFALWVEEFTVPTASTVKNLESPTPEPAHW